MHISKIRIQNYRNFSDFSMEFRKGLNVIIGSNNSGKTGLLYAVHMLNNPSGISVHDFNKNVLFDYKAFTEDAPQIILEYEIQHEISEDDDFKMQLKSSPSIAKQHKVPIKEYVWSVVRKLTHNEILYFGYRILELNSTALYTLRVKFPFIFVDEFQDTNPLQTLLIKLIGEKSTVIGVIGDVAQSIYSFQGARPSQFSDFSVGDSKILTDYIIDGNRRSTANIVNFCNFIRKADTLVSQTSIRLYKSDSEKVDTEAKPIRFLVGNDDATKKIIAEVINDGGVVLTRAWAKAFSYIRDIEDEQVKLLSSIYNSYYNTPIDIRVEITELGNVTWVRAFKFIFFLHKAFTDGSFVDALKAFRLYADIDRRKLNFKLLRQIKAIADEVFEGLSDASSTVSIIEKFNANLQEAKHSILRVDLLGEDFSASIFDEYDLTSGSKKSLKFMDELSKLTWETSHKLFTEVFSPNSRYMTVHQAKGLEWDKVIVAAEPNKFDDTKLTDMYSDPQILKETSADEFVRMYYVACSRAKEELYIHLPDGFDRATIETALSGYEVKYEFI